MNAMETLSAYEEMIANGVDLAEYERRIARPFRDKILQIAKRRFAAMGKPYRWDDISLLAQQSHYETACRRFFV